MKKIIIALIIILTLLATFFTARGAHYEHKAKTILEMSRKKTTEEFIELTKFIHGNRYNYSKVIYKNAKEKVCIICPERHRIC